MADLRSTAVFLLVFSPVLCAAVTLEEAWHLKRVPEPTAPPRDPLEVRLGRSLTPPEYRQWQKDHEQRAGPQKRLNKPHVMSSEQYKKYLMTKPLKPTVAPTQEAKDVTVRFAKTAKSAASVVKAAVSAAMETAKQETAQKAEEHRAWLEEQRAERKHREELERNAANKGKERQDWLRKAAAERKAKILAKEHTQEEYLRKQEEKMEEKIRAEKEAIVQENKDQIAMNGAMHWAEFHYVKAPVGEDCPNHWHAVMSLDACKLAQKALGGIDMTNTRVASNTRPGGCYSHTTSSHIAFNTDLGHLSHDTERICEKKRAASRGELQKLYKKVVASEIAQQNFENDLSDDEAPNFEQEAAMELRQKS